MAAIVMLLIIISFTKSIQAQAITDSALAIQILYEGNQLYFACLSQADQINNALANNRPYPNVPKKFISEKDVKYLLFTQKNPSTPQTLKISDSSEALENSNYDSSKKTILYIPGLSDASSDAASQLPRSKFINNNFISGSQPFGVCIADAQTGILTKMDVNLIITNWDSYAFYDGTYAVNRTVPLLANICVKFIRMLFNQGATANQMFFIGYSAGGQAIGLMGKKLKGIDKIFAIDPAAPCYTHQPSAKKLSSSDAKTVEILHCTGGILGVPPHYTVKNDFFYGYQGIFQRTCRSSGNAYQVGICSHVLCKTLFYQDVDKFVIRGQ